MSDFSTDEEEENFLGEYDGARNEASERHGFGKTILANRDIYQGYYKHGKRNGKGYYRFKRNSCRYTGEWLDSLKSGRGVFVYPDGSKYEGLWKSDRKNGKGMYLFANGSKYVGLWKDDLREGFGAMFYKRERCCYIGEWLNDKRHGKGIMTYKDYRYFGSWESGHPQGPGDYVFSNGCVQQGYYSFQEDDGATMNGISDTDALTANTPIWTILSVLYGEEARSRIEELNTLEVDVKTRLNLGSARNTPQVPALADSMTDVFKPIQSEVDQEVGVGEQAVPGGDTTVNDPDVSEEMVEDSEFSSEQRKRDEVIEGDLINDTTPRDYTMDMKEGDEEFVVDE